MKFLRRRNLWQWLLLALALGLLWFTLRSVPLADVWAQLRQLRPTDLLLLVVANVLVLGTFSARWWILLYAQGYRLPYHKLMGYRLATFAVSYFTPGPHFGGEPLQVYLVTRRHAVPTAASLTAVVLDKLIEMLFNFTFVVLGALFVLDWQRGPVAGAQLWSTLGFGALFLLPVAILGALAAGRHPLSRPLAALLGAWSRLRSTIAASSTTGASTIAASTASAASAATAGVHAAPAQRGAGVSTHTRLGHFVITLRESEDLGRGLFRQRPGLLAAAVVVTIISWLAIVAEFWLMTHILGLGLSLPDALVALLAARAAILLPLPAAVGALEASQALAMVSLGLPAAYGISLSLLIRARDVLLGLSGLALSTAYLNPRPAKSPN